VLQAISVQGPSNDTQKKLMTLMLQLFSIQQLLLPVKSLLFQLARMQH